MIEQIENDIEDSGIRIIKTGISDKRIKAMSFLAGNREKFIAVDVSKCNGKGEYKSVLLHERAHCDTLSFYSMSAENGQREYAEGKADAYIAKKYITRSDIDRAQKEYGFYYAEDFAEYFGVTNLLMNKILSYIQHREPPTQEALCS